MKSCWLKASGSCKKSSLRSKISCNNIKPWSKTWLIIRRSAARKSWFLWVGSGLFVGNWFILTKFMCIWEQIISCRGLLMNAPALSIDAKKCWGNSSAKSSKPFKNKQALRTLSFQTEKKSKRLIGTKKVCWKLTSLSKKKSPNPYWRRKEVLSILILSSLLFRLPKVRPTSARPCKRNNNSRHRTMLSRKSLTRCNRLQFKRCKSWHRKLLSALPNSRKLKQANRQRK